VSIGAVVSVGGTAGVCATVADVAGAAEVQAYAIKMTMNNVMTLIVGFMSIPFTEQEIQTMVNGESRRLPLL
jgi:hypothetical protein